MTAATFYEKMSRYQANWEKSNQFAKGNAKLIDLQTHPLILLVTKKSQPTIKVDGLLMSFIKLNQSRTAIYMQLHLIYVLEFFEAKC